MAKKKKSRKKQLQRQANRQSQQLKKDNQVTEAVKTESTGNDLADKDVKAKTVKKANLSIDEQINIDAEQHKYVKKDVSHIVVIALILIGVMLLLWFILDKTSLGESVYRLIRV